MPQHAEFGAAGEGGRTRRKAHAGEPDEHRDGFQRIGDGKCAIKDAQASLAQRRAGQDLERVAAREAGAQRGLRQLSASAPASSQMEPSLALSSPVAAMYA